MNYWLQCEYLLKTEVQISEFLLIFFFIMAQWTVQNSVSDLPPLKRCFLMTKYNALRAKRQVKITSRKCPSSCSTVDVQ